MKTIAAMVLLSCWALAQDKTAISAAEAGCGPQDKKVEVNSDESEHPAPMPEDGKAVIYFVAPKQTSVFGIDGKWVGAARDGRYFFVQIEPGEHHLCARWHSLGGGGPRVSVHSLKAESGGSYYFRTRLYQIEAGFGDGFQLEQLDPDEGRWFVAWSKFSPSHSKD